mmetsp:Transcript_1923/g.2657  ORF Transcript_1923/g.2657 Transcript_1923/m.2657 type:complete len:92 (-) Transcript_1923:20-295(-)
MPKNLRFYAANAAAAGLLISAVKFPLRGSTIASVVSQLELFSVVALMDRLPGAGLIGAISAAASLKLSLDNKVATTKRVFWNKIILVGAAG